MKILYITELWNGFEDLICRGKPEAAGMPSFIYPLKEMIINRGFLIDFAIVTKEPRELNIGAAWLMDSNYCWVVDRSFLKIFTLFRIIQRGKYDFIYGHGGGGGWGNFAAILARKPFGMRYYGTFLAQHLDENNFKFFSRNLLKSFVYNLPKCFMLMTNDGTKGDRVYNRLCLNKRSYVFKFWLNGVNESTEEGNNDAYQSVITKIKLKSIDRLLLYPSRYDPWKRQEFALEIMKELSNNSNNKFTLMYCGHKYDQEYFNRLVNLVSSDGLKDYVVFSDTIEPQALRELMQKAFAVFSFYEFSNLGNVIIEASTSGSFVVTIKDGSTDFLIENGVTGISLPDDKNYIPSVAAQLVYYSENPELRNVLRDNLQQRADRIFMSWKERSRNEINLIENSIY